MRKIVIVLLFVLLGVVAAYYLRHPLGAKVKIGDHVIPVELAVTEDEKQRGLGFRPSLAPDHGMLFVYDHKEQFNFWMRGMQFPLDFIWIDGGTIAEITPNIPAPKPGEQLRVYTPKSEIDKILEVNAGMVEKYEIRVGDTVEYTN